jgi:hypothetical protein
MTENIERQTCAGGTEAAENTSAPGAENIERPFGLREALEQEAREREATENIERRFAVLRSALESLRDAGDRPGMLQEGEQALSALDSLERTLLAALKERDEALVRVKRQHDMLVRKEREAEVYRGRADVTTQQRNRAERAERERDELENQMLELSRCVRNGWTEPAFIRGQLHRRAVEIASAALAEDAGRKQ